MDSRRADPSIEPGRARGALRVRWGWFAIFRALRFVEQEAWLLTVLLIAKIWRMRIIRQIGQVVLDCDPTAPGPLTGESNLSCSSLGGQHCVSRARPRLCTWLSDRPMDAVLTPKWWPSPRAAWGFRACGKEPPCCGTVSFTSKSTGTRILLQIPLAGRQDVRPSCRGVKNKGLSSTRWPFDS
jgi:hypothetical protein